MDKSARGFTLIELMITVSIIAVLSVIGTAVFTSVTKQGRDSKRLADLRSVQSALEQYYRDQGFYPCATCPQSDPYWGLDVALGNSGLNKLTNKTGNDPSGVYDSVKTYLNALPKDPNSSLRYMYSAARRQADGSLYYGNVSGGGCNNISIKCVSYCLYAKIENSTALNIGNCPISDTFGFTPPGDYRYAVASP